MSDNIVLPDYLVPMSPFSEPVQVVVGPEVKMDRDHPDQVKTSRFFSDRTPYTLTVEYARGRREKITPDGQRHQVAVFDTQTVTVWMQGSLSVTPGQYVVLENAGAGSMGGTTYVQATGCTVYEPEKKG